MKQSEAFMIDEGDRWLERNPHLGDSDPVCAAIDHLELRPQSVLEIGCANGWRLDALHKKFKCDVTGVDPSHQAGMEAAARRVPVYQATADSLPIPDDEFDVVIYGFCLYLTDPQDWFQIVSEGDRVLSSGGYLIVHDFDDPRAPFARQYHHRKDVLSYHMRFASLWQAHPWYRMVYTRSDAPSDECVTVLRKNVDAMPVMP